MKLYKFIITPIVMVLALSACERINAIVEPHKTSGVGDYLAAQFAFSNNDLKAANKYYANVIKYKPNDISVLKKYLDVTLIDGRINDSISIVQDILLLDPDHDLSLIITAHQHIKDNNYPKAINALAQSKESSSLTIKVMLAWLEVLHNNKSIEDVFVQALKTDDVIAKDFITKQQAMLAYASGDNKLAKELFEKIFKNPQYEAPLIKAAISFYHSVGDGEKAKAITDQLYKSLKITKDDAKYDLKLSELDNGKENKNLKEYFANITTRSALLSANTSPDELIKHITIAYSFNEGDYGLNLTLAELLIKRGLPENAIKLLDKIPSESPYYHLARSSIAISYEAQGDTQKALDTILKYSKIDTKNHEPLLVLGDIMSLQKKFTEAEKYYSQAIDRLQKHGEIKKRHWSLIFARGICYERMGQWEKAEKDLLKAAELYPNQPDVINYLAYSWLEMGINFDKAEKMLRLAIISRPNDTHIIDSYGWALFKMGRYENALRFIEKANSDFPTDAITNEHLGDVYWHVGRKQEAQYQWDHALRLSTEEKDRPRLLDKIQNGLPAESTRKKEGS